MAEDLTERQVYCPHCGHRVVVREERRFCPKCGFRLWVSLDNPWEPDPRKPA